MKDVVSDGPRVVLKKRLGHLLSKTPLLALYLASDDLFYFSLLGLFLS